MSDQPAPPARKKKLSERLLPLVERIRPLTQAAERIGHLAVHIKEPSAMGLLMMASTGTNAVRDFLSERRSPGWGLELVISRGYVVEAFQRAGASIHTETFGNGAQVTTIHIHGESFKITADGVLAMDQSPDPQFLEWVRQVIDPALPPVIEIHRGAGVESYKSIPGSLTTMATTQGKEVLAATLPFLVDESRCILLSGRPGVGKTTMAQEVARSANLGRVVLIEAGVIGSPREGGSMLSSPQNQTKFNAGGEMLDALRLLSPGTIIVDDIDKVHLHLPQIKALRTAARLVIFTANNGAHDEVLDGALLRPERVDEVFAITAEHAIRRPPFDQLPDAIWEEVREWPIAFLNDLEKRMKKRGDNLRLDDLRERVKKKTRSGAGLYD